MKKYLTFAFLLLLFAFTLSGCFSNEEDTGSVKNEILQSLENIDEQDQRLEGSASLNLLEHLQGAPQDTWLTQLFEHTWHWNGRTMDSDFEIQFSFDEGPVSMILKGTNQELFVHLQEFNEEDEFISFPSEDASTTTKVNVVTNFLYELISQMDENKMVLETDENRISVPIHYDDLSIWKQELSAALNQAPAPIHWGLNEIQILEWIDWLQKSSEPESDTSEPAALGNLLFDISTEGNLDQLHIAIEVEGFTFHWEQSFEHLSGTNENLVIESPKVILPWTDVQMILEEIVAEPDQSGPDTIDLEEGVSWETSYSYPDQSAYHQMSLTVEQLLKSIVDQNQNSFMSAFRRPEFAERHLAWIETDRKFRFLKVEDLQFKNTSGTVNIGVFFEYADPGDQAISESAVTLSLKKNEVGDWKIENMK